MAGRCDDYLNNLQLRITGPGVPPHLGCSAARTTCGVVHPPGFLGAHGFTGKDFDVCDNCSDQAQRILAVRQTPVGPAQASAANLTKMNRVGPPRIAATPSAPPPHWQTPGEFATGIVNAPPIPKFDSFLTRLCKACERHEQSEASYRAEAVDPQRGASMTYFEEYAVTQVEIPDITPWDHYPYSTCICKHLIGASRNNGQVALTNPILAYGDLRPRMCLRHRQLEWQRLITARDANSHWLRNIELRNPNIPTSTALKKATAQTKRTRVQGAGTWRACRVSQINISLIRNLLMFL